MKLLSHIFLFVCTFVAGCVHTAPEVHTGTGLPSDRYDYLWNACLFWIGSLESKSTRQQKVEQAISKKLFDVWLHPEQYKFRPLSEFMSKKDVVVEMMRLHHESRRHDFAHLFANDSRLPASYRLEVVKAASTLDKVIRNNTSQAIGAPAPLHGR